MNPSAGLVTALNKMREMSVSSGDIFHQYFPIVDANTNIGEWGAPIFGSNYQAVQESFFGLLKQIAYVATVTRLFDNPLAQLEGENMPLGWAGEETYINPVKGRQFDVNDFAGILQKYEADVKVQYLTVNMDLQYPVTLTRDKIRQAFNSWRDLEEFINGIVNALCWKRGEPLLRLPGCLLIPAPHQQPHSSSVLCVLALRKKPAVKGHQIPVNQWRDRAAAGLPQGHRANATLGTLKGFSEEETLNWLRKNE